MGKMTILQPILGEESLGFLSLTSSSFIAPSFFPLSPPFLSETLDAFFKHYVYGSYKA
jgi:hypothetical protein